MTKRLFWDLAYFRACSLPTSGLLSSDFGLKNDEREAFGVQKQEVDEPLARLFKVLAKFLPDRWT